MSNIVYDKSKAIETILYLAKKISNPSKLNICKMIYHADKLSLVKYGRLIFGGEYCAMKHGPVPSEAYDLLKEYIQHPVEFKVDAKNPYRVTALRDANLDYLSESDQECLEQTMRQYDGAWEKMYQDAHDAAWEETWNNKSGSSNSVRMTLHSIVNTLPDSADLLDYLTECGVC